MSACVLQGTSLQHILVFGSRVCRCHGNGDGRTPGGGGLSSSSLFFSLLVTVSEELLTFVSASQHNRAAEYVSIVKQ